MSANQNDDLAKLSLREAYDLIRKKKVSPVELTKACLTRIDRANPSLNAFITITSESALQQAREAEAEVMRGKWRGPLHGIPIALKDLFDTAGVKTTAGSGVFKDRVPTEDAEVVRRLKAAGAVLLGKTNMQEFAFGGTSIVSYFGPVHNPWELSHISGGSSGGSAAALAAELCYGALGSDTAGSVRIPASHCGIVGLKPTYGLVSIRGVIPLSWSLDHVGPMARSVEDTALLLQVIAGYDEKDTTSEQMNVSDYSQAIGKKVSSLRIGAPREFFFADLDPEIDAAMKEALSVLGKTHRGNSRCGAAGKHDGIFTRRREGRRSLCVPPRIRCQNTGTLPTAHAETDSSRCQCNHTCLHPRAAGPRPGTAGRRKMV